MKKQVDVKNMIANVKQFFGIEMAYRFEITDLTTLFTVLNVVLVLLGFWWAPVIGIVNCVIGIGVNIKNRLHINMYIIQFALIVLNAYFLTL